MFAPTQETQTTPSVAPNRAFASQKATAATPANDDIAYSGPTTLERRRRRTTRRSNR